MAIQYWVGGRITGLSTDSKPDHAGLTGYIFYEIDTGTTSYHNGTAWAVKTLSSQWMPFAFVVYKAGSDYKALNVASGVVESTSSTDASIPINYCVDAIDGTDEGGRIMVDRGRYTCLTELSMVSADRGMELKGIGRQTWLDFTPGSALTDGIHLEMQNPRLRDFRISANSNVTHFIAFKGPGLRGILDNVYFDGYGITAGQVALYQDGSVGSVGHWSMTNNFFNLIDTGFLADGSVGSNATATQWINTVFSDVNVGFDLGCSQHQITNVYHQGNATNGVTTVRLRSPDVGVGQDCKITNVVAELFKTGTNCQTVLLESGAKYNLIVGASNYKDDGGIWRTVVNNSGNTSNVILYSDGIQGGVNDVQPTLSVRHLDSEVVPTHWSKEYLRYGALNTMNSTSSADIGIGCLTGFLTGVGTWGYGFDNDHGPYGTLTTGSTSGDDAGLYTNSTLTRVARDFRLDAAFSLNSTSDIRPFIGMFTGGTPGGSDPLSGDHGFALTVDSSNFKIAHNDGTGATVFSDFSPSKIADTGYHRLRIQADSSTPSITADLDRGTNTVTVSSDIPSSSWGIKGCALVETQTSAAKSMGLYLYEGLF